MRIIGIKIMIFFRYTLTQVCMKNVLFDSLSSLHNLKKKQSLCPRQTFCQSFKFNTVNNIRTGQFSFFHFSGWTKQFAMFASLDNFKKVRYGFPSELQLYCLEHFYTRSTRPVIRNVRIWPLFILFVTINIKSRFLAKCLEAVYSEPTIFSVFFFVFGDVIGRRTVTFGISIHFQF